MKPIGNFEDFIVRAVDAMLISGRAPVKIRWNSAKSRLEFTVVPPLRFIVPPWTRALQDADWICQVHTISVDEYMRSGIYDKDPDLVRSITGRGSEAGMVAETNRRLREGVTHSDQEMIVIWEIWHRDDQGRWIVTSHSGRPPAERPNRLTETRALCRSICLRMRPSRAYGVKPG